MKKKYFYLIAALATATMTLSSCINDDYDPELLRLAVDGLGTKAGTRAKTDATDLQYQQFVANERIHVDAYEYNSTTPVTTPYTQGTYNTTDASGTLSGSLYYHATKTVDIEAYYPYTVTYNTSSFTVQTTQNDSANYKASDLMYATRLTNKAKGTIWPLTFNHALSQIVVTLTAGDGLTASDITTNVTSVDIKNVKTQGAITNSLSAASPAYTVAATGAAGDINIFSSTVTTESQTAATSTGIIVPQTVNSGTVLFSITYNGNTYTHTLTANQTFAAGYTYTYAFTLNLAGIELSSTSINNWTAGVGGSPSLNL